MTRSQPDGYLATPAAGSGPGVLVLHAWWGLNETIRTVCDRLAAAGFVAFAPDLYHGLVAETIPAAEALGSALDANFEQARAEVAAAAAYLDELAGLPGRGVAVVAFSLGVYYAFDLAAAHPDRVHAVVIFYGSGDADFSQSKAAYLGHFAAEDEYEPEPAVAALEKSLQQAGRPVTFYRYPDTGHWFFEPDRTAVYDDEAAQLAWERTLAFLHDAVR
jgi:carboxymethylenebutenolidase